MENLEQVADGLYVDSSTKAITISPDQIGFDRYTMLNTLGHAEHEDIGARLAEASVAQGQWVGMSYRKLSRMLSDEVNIMFNDYKEQEKAGKGILRRVYEYFFGSGPEQEEAQADQPVSMLALKIFMHVQNAAAIIGEAITTMAEKGYLNLIEGGDQDYLMPTQKLAETIHKRQSGE